MLTILLLVLTQMSANAAGGSKPDDLSDLPPGVKCTPSQSQCCWVKIAVDRCKAAAISEGKEPEMTPEESAHILGSGPKTLSVMNCIRHEKSSGHWQGARNDCQKQLDGCIDVCGKPDAGSWPADHCKKAVEPILALIDGAKAESDNAVAGSRDVLKALTGADDAGVDKILSDARKQGDQTQASAAQQTQTPSVTPPAMSTPSVPADQVAGTPANGGNWSARPPSATPPVLATPPAATSPIVLPNPPARDQILGQPVRGGGTGGSATLFPIVQGSPPANPTTDRVIAGTLDAQVRATAAKNAAALRQFSLEDEGAKPSADQGSYAARPTFDEMGSAGR